MTNSEDSANGFATNHQIIHGLTKREYFAATAMQGILSGKVGKNVAAADHDDMCEVVATLSIYYADALIAALNDEAE